MFTWRAGVRHDDVVGVDAGALRTRGEGAAGVLELAEGLVLAELEQHGPVDGRRVLERLDAVAGRRRAAAAVTRLTVEAVHGALDVDRFVVGTEECDDLQVTAEARL